MHQAKPVTNSHVKRGFCQTLFGALNCSLLLAYSLLQRATAGAWRGKALPTAGTDIKASGSGL